MVGDPIGDLIIQLKNASAVGKNAVSLSYSTLRFSVSEKLRARGFIKAVGKHGKKTRKFLDIELLYSGDEKKSPRISGVLRVSKPGRRMYASVKDIRPVRNGSGLLILSTPKGILTGDEARKEHVGGEVLFKIW